MADLHHQIDIAAPPEKIYEALATETGLKRWWTADTHADEKVGGVAEFGFGQRSVVFRMRIEQLDPGRRVVWTCDGGHPEWKGTKLTWEIRRGATDPLSSDNVTTLRLRHSGWKEISDFYASCNSTWGELMWRLKDELEGRQPGPHWRE
jgi:uncharacterized protein YndB with AHSA1/START domain